MTQQIGNLRIIIRDGEKILQMRRFEKKTGIGKIVDKWTEWEDVPTIEGDDIGN